MSTQIATSRRTAFEAGWIIMLIISILATLNAVMLPVYGDPVALSIGWTGFSLYATVVLAIPFCRGERRAWYTSWLLVIAFAAPILLSRESYIVMYLIAAGVFALCLLLTRTAFFRKGV
jgi:hypothetical protein